MRRRCVHWQSLSRTPMARSLPNSRPPAGVALLLCRCCFWLSRENRLAHGPARSHRSTAQTPHCAAHHFTEQHATAHHFTPHHSTPIHTTDTSAHQSTPEHSTPLTTDTPRVGALPTDSTNTERMLRKLPHLKDSRTGLIIRGSTTHKATEERIPSTHIAHKRRTSVPPLTRRQKVGNYLARYLRR